MSYQNIWKENVLHRTFSEKTSAKEVLDSNLLIHGDSRFDRINYIINDFTQIDDFEVTEPEVREIVAIDNAAVNSKPRLKIAIVATLQPLLEWINLYCKKMESSSYECKIFSDKDDAHEWTSKL